MADIIDQADELIELNSRNEIEHIRKLAELMPQGERGDCDYCGEFSLRLVNNACARCRDKYKLG